MVNNNLERIILSIWEDCNTVIYGKQKPTPTCVVFEDADSLRLEKVRIFSFGNSKENNSCFELVVPHTLTSTTASMLIPLFLATLSNSFSIGEK